MNNDLHPLLQQGYRDGLQGRKPALPDDKLYMMGYVDGRDDDIRHEMLRDRFNGEASLARNFP